MRAVIAFTALIGCTVIAVLVVAWIKRTSSDMLQRSSVFSERTLVTEFTGFDDTHTKYFTVKDDWELEWKVRGEMWLINVTRGLDQLPQHTIAAYGVLRDEDSRNMSTGGHYMLTVRARGPWRIRIYQWPGKI